MAIVSMLYGAGGASSAEDVSYDNTTSGLEADNVQDAIDEVIPIYFKDGDVIGSSVVGGSYVDMGGYTNGNEILWFYSTGAANVIITTTKSLKNIKTISGETFYDPSNPTAPYGYMEPILKANVSTVVHPVFHDFSFDIIDDNHIKMSVKAKNNETQLIGGYLILPLMNGIKLTVHE